MNEMNCTFLVVRPKPEIKDWLNSVCLRYKIVPTFIKKMSDERLMFDSPVFVIPKMQEGFDFMHYFDEHGPAIFETVLQEWIPDQSVWPKPLDFQQFEKLFSIEIYDHVFYNIPQSPIETEQKAA